MSYTRETIVLHSTTPDLIPADAPATAWNRSHNVAFRSEETVTAVEDRDIFPGMPINPKTLVYVEPNNTGYWVAAAQNGIFATDGSIVYDITPGGWNAFDFETIWTSTVLNGLAVINASDDDPVYWDGNPANPCQKLPGWPDGGRCYAIRAHKSFLFAVGFYSDNGARVRWSDAAEAGTIPQAWEPAGDNLAGFVDLSPAATDCVDARDMRDDLVIYKRESIWAATFVGGNAVFNFRTMFREHGCAATNAITRGPDDNHLFLGADGDIHLTDGVDVRSVLDGRAQRTFYQEFIDPARGIYAAATLMREKLGMILYPTQDATRADQMLLYDFSSGDISFRDAPQVFCAGVGRMLEDVGDQNQWDPDAEEWNADQSAWNQEVNAQSVEDVLFGTLTEPMLFMGGDKALNVQLEKSGLAYGNPQRRKVCNRIWPKVVGVEGDVLTFRIGGQETAGGPTSLSDPVDFVIGSGAAIDTFASGRFLTLLVESSDTSSWRMGSIDVEYREAGAF